MPRSRSRVRTPSFAPNGEATCKGRFVRLGCRDGGTCLPAGRLVDTQSMFVVYAIKSTTRNYIYVGLTNNLDRRIEEHNSGSNKTTKPYSPFSLIHSEEFLDRKKARTREKQLKSGYGKEFLKSLLE